MVGSKEPPSARGGDGMFTNNQVSGSPWTGFSSDKRKVVGTGCAYVFPTDSTKSNVAENPSNSMNCT